MPRKGRIERETPVHLVGPDPASLVKLPPPPAHLSEEMQAWWRAVVAEYEFERHHLLLLETACDAWDRLQEARDVLAREGLTIETSTGQKMHPAVIIERDSRTAFVRTVRELDLDMVPAADSQSFRPPALRSNRG
jgi:P27 family predicted phage terminase small subunit